MAHELHPPAASVGGLEALDLRSIPPLQSWSTKTGRVDDITVEIAAEKRCAGLILLVGSQGNEFTLF